MARQTQKLVFIFALFLFTSGLAVSAQNEPVVCTANGGDWDSAQEVCLITDSGQNASGINYSYEVHYPTSIAYEPFITSALNGVIQPLIDQFMMGVNGTPDSPGDLFMKTTFNVYEHSPDIFSVVFDVSDYLGGAHPNLVVHALTFNRATQQRLWFQDLFSSNDPLSVIEPIVVADLQTQLGPDASTLQWIQDGTGQNFNNYRNFAVDAETLILFFEPYQVAPYAAGKLTVKVPLSQLAAIWGPGGGTSACAGSLAPRLVVGDRGRIARAYSTLRAQPAGDPIEVVYAPAQFDVLQGPRCAGYGPLIWYEIEYDNGLKGWASESQVNSIWGSNQYWLEAVSNP